MKNRITFFMFLMFGLFFVFSPKTEVKAQTGADADTVPNLIFSEIRKIGGGARWGDYFYMEIANVGDSALNLKDFEINHFRTFNDFNTSNHPIPLPDTVLQPNSTLVMGLINDYHDRHLDDFSIHGPTWVDMFDKIDFPQYTDEGVPPGGGYDSVSPWNEGWDRMNLTWGEHCTYIEYHYPTGDSALADVLFGSFDENKNFVPSDGEADIAGVNADEGYYLFRKTSVKDGSTDWDQSRGGDVGDSEWLPVPYRDITAGRLTKTFTTIGHHGDADLTDQTVVPNNDNVSIDWDNNKITVPWGIRNQFIMDEFDLGPGIAWHYNLSGNREDSVHNVVNTGDTLTLYAVGNELMVKDFHLEQGPAANDNALVIHTNNRNVDPEDGDVWWTTPFYVTKDDPEMDSIQDVAFAERVDTLLKYLEKAPNATWEIKWVDGQERVDVKRGDILEVTAEDGSTTKEYFINADSVPPLSQNTNLSAITWPEAPAFLQNTPHWNHDTIPGFSSSKKAYEITVPYGTSAVPALKAYTQDLNATIDSVHRAISLSGPKENRTTSIVVRAEDDTTTTTYDVTFVEEKPERFIQPYKGEPMITQLGLGIYERRISYLEISVPGNQTVDLSNYMITNMSPPTDPNQLITNNWDDWSNRYVHYVPGYDFVADSASQWNNIPGIIEKDLAVNPVLQGGESFVIGHNHSWRFQDHHQNNHNWVAGDIDVYFTRQQFWDRREYFGLDQVQKMVTNGNDGISLTSDPAYFGEPGKNVVAIFKILNEEVKNGNKALGEDPADYQLIEVFGDYASDAAYSPGKDTLPDAWNNGIWRKPEYFTPDTAPGVQGSWANTDEESEWIYIGDQHLPEDIGYDDKNRTVGGGLGNHIFDPITIHESTVASLVYKVSDGYESPQDIKGVVAGTTVSDFMANLIPAHEEQELVVEGKGENDGIAEGDVLKVTSANDSNITEYNLIIGALSDDAELTSQEYTIEIDGGEGTISGIEMGTTVQEVIANVTKPQFATLYVTDEKVENLIPLKSLDVDTNYVNTLAKDNIKFEVIAENGTDRIVYDLKLAIPNNEAYLFSEVYTVDQEMRYVSRIPNGTNVKTLFEHLKANKGAGTKVIDRIGAERTMGDLKGDDMIVVKSPDGTKEKYYNLELVSEAGQENDAWVVSDVFTVNQVSDEISEIEDGMSVVIFNNLVRKAPNSTMTLHDSEGNEKTSGDIMTGDQLMVVSGNGKYSVTYELFIEGTEAKVFSNLYTVDQQDMVISGVAANTDLGVFAGNLEPSVGASMEVRDADGNKVEEGMILEGYQVYVVSGDGNLNNTYSINLQDYDAYALAKTQDLLVSQDPRNISLIPPETSIADFKAMLELAPEATMMVVDADGNEVTEGTITEELKLKVVSADGSKEVLYNLDIAEPGTEAYVLAVNTVAVDQDDLEISLIPKVTTVADFKTMVEPVEGATMKVLDGPDGSEVTEGNISAGYVLEVISGDETKTVEYELLLVTSIRSITGQHEISIYPNPARDVVMIKGLEDNSHIIIKNILGKTVKLLNSQDIIDGVISVNELSSGIYFINIKSKQHQYNPVKLIIE